MYNSPTAPIGTGLNAGDRTCICMFQIGAPIGGVRSPSAFLHSQAVTSIAASVGPYRFHKSACSISPRAFCCSGPPKASPLVTMWRMEDRSAFSALSTNADNIEATKCSVVMPLASMTAAIYFGFLCSPGAATTSCAPFSKGSKNSQTETSNENGVFCKTRSRSVNFKSCCIHSIRFTTASCVLPAPLGLPVLPEV